jgi:hypothetical protein
VLGQNAAFRRPPCNVFKKTETGLCHTFNPKF